MNGRRGSPQYCAMMRKALLLQSISFAADRRTSGKADNMGYCRHRAGLPIRNPQLVVDRRWLLVLSPEGSSIRSLKPTAVTHS
jgi:hypothetical protein